MIATENEEAIIACMLSYPDQSMPYLASEMRPEHFISMNGEVFRHGLAIFTEGNGLTMLALCGRLRDAGLLDKVGGIGRLTGIQNNPIMPSQLPEHVRAVKDKAAQRKMIRLLETSLDQAQSQTCDVSELTATITSEIESISHDRAKRKVPSMKELVTSAVQRIQKRHDGDVDAVGVSTGIPKLDKETGGLRPGSQWVLAGPAKGGKSALAGGFLRSMAVTHKQRCAFFGLEMPSVENVERLICHEGRISATGIRDGKLTSHDFTRLSAAAQTLSQTPILFRDDIFDLGELIGTARQMKSAYPDLFAIVVDYAQLLVADADEKNREREVAVISRTLRKFSMQTGVAVILLSQVNDDGKLRESRALGMDATKIVFIEFTENPGTRKLRLVQRDGGSGVVIEVAYRGEYFQFADLADETEEVPMVPQRNGKHPR